jgi:N-acetylneuraminate synthase
VAIDIFEDLFVLELANNHWGKLERGLKIIDDFAAVVKANGVRASIKLQFRNVDEFIHRDYRDCSDVRYISKTLATQMPWDDLRTMVDRVKAQGMIAMVTPFDEVSVDKCVEFGVDILKIASSDIRDKTLLRKIAATGLPVVASSGGADAHHLDALVEYFTSRKIPFALNHCVSIYPSEDSELELNQIDYLKARYPGITIGLSTHEQRDWHDSILIAYAKGARTFERHVDIDYEGVPVSAYCTRPEQADVWFKAFNKAKEMCGGPAAAKRVVPAKEREYLDALVRGVYVKRDLPAGHVLTDADVYLAVPLLKGQISTREFECGEILKGPLAADEPVLLGDIDAHYVSDPEVRRLVPDRGLARRLPDMKIAVNQ